MVRSWFHTTARLRGGPSKISFTLGGSKGEPYASSRLYGRFSVYDKYPTNIHLWYFFLYASTLLPVRTKSTTKLVGDIPTTAELRQGTYII